MKLREDFSKIHLDKTLTWLNEPERWKLENNQLHVYTEAKTDFWQRTHYGFRANNGHFLYGTFEGDFTLEAGIHCDFVNQYDQAGLMIRVSDECWIKTSVESEPDEYNKLGVVVTNNGYSDWSTQDVLKSFTSYKLRITRKGSDYKVEFFNETRQYWVQMRIFHLFDQKVVEAGIYCCSPKEAGFRARFDYLRID